jgi:hypothetical protein
MPPYEVTKLVRSAGFEPLAPPLREGTTYVLRATDFRGILMRVVVDARSGAFRAVNRIVSGPGPYGPIGMATPPYGMPPPYAVPPPYGLPAAYGPPDGAEMMPEQEVLAPSLPPPTMRPGMHPFASAPPLPRPRPAELAAREPKAGLPPSETPVVKPQANPGATVAAPSSVPAPSKKPPPPPPINE